VRIPSAVIVNRWGLYEPIKWKTVKQIPKPPTRTPIKRMKGEAHLGTKLDVTV